MSYLTLKLEKRIKLYQSLKRFEASNKYSDSFDSLKKVDFTMIYKFVAVSIFFGLVLADPVPEISSSSAREMGFLSTLIDGNSSEQSSDLARIVKPSLILDLISALVGYKASALLIAVDIIDWLVSKSFIIVIGAILTFGFCKITDKCNLDYEQYVPVAQFRSLATPERLARAEKFLVAAVEKYAQKKKASLPSNSL